MLQRVLVVGVLILMLCGVAAASGNVTVTTEKSSYYFGEIIHLSGINHASNFTYLYVKGPNFLPSNGARLTDFKQEVITGNPTTFDRAPVNADGSWEFTWDTAPIGFRSDAGTYTLIANANPNGAQSYISRNEIAGISFNLKKSFISISIKKTNIEKGTQIPLKIAIEGFESSTVAIWIVGDDYVSRDTTIVSVGGTYYNIPTDNLSPGQYSIIIQSPMYDKQLQAISIGGLKGEAAEQAILDVINADNVDDTYSKVQVTIAALPTTVTTTPIVTTVPTTLPTTVIPIPTPTETQNLTEFCSIEPNSTLCISPSPLPTENIIEKIATLEAKVAAQETQIAQQQAKIEEQQGIINQILAFLKTIFR